MSSLITFLLFAAIAGVFLIVLILAASYYPVPQSHVVLVERFGRFHRTLRAGINFVLPFLDRVVNLSDWGQTANKAYRGRHVLMELAEQFTDTGSRPAATRDNAQVEVDASVYWQIIDPVRARYEVDRLPPSVADMALNVLRTAIGMVTLDQALSERTKINQYLLSNLTKSCDKWGVKIVRVEVQSIKPAGEGVGLAMVQEMAAERERRASILRAQGEKEAALLRAHAEKEASIVRAQGEAESIKIRTTAELERIQALGSQVGVAHALSAVLSWKYFETLSQMAKDPATKIFLPTTDSRSAWASGMLADLATGALHDGAGKRTPLSADSPAGASPQARQVSG